MDRQKSYVLKVLLLGDAGVGRRTLIQRFVGYDFFEEGYYRLTGTSFGVCQLEFGEALVAIQLWMLGSEPWFQSLRQSHYRGSVGAIFVFSVTNRTSFERIPGLAKEILRTQGILPTVVLGTKVDLADERVISTDEGRALARELGSAYSETSTSNDQGILAMFQYLVEEIIKPEGPPRTLVRIPLASAPSQQAPVQAEKLAPTVEEDPIEASEVLLSSLASRELSQQEFDERMELVLEKLSVEDALFCDYLRSLSAAGHRETVVHRLQNLQKERALQQEQPSVPKTQRGVVEEPVIEPEIKLEDLSDPEIARLTREEFDELVTQALRRLGQGENQEMREYLISLSAAGHREIVLYKLRTL
jgi:small GTP-binding protein